MQLTVRSLQSEDDYWRIRNFLRTVFLINGRRELSWHVARLDYWRWHFVKNCELCGPLQEVTTIWETARGKIVAALHPLTPGEAILHVHPGFRSRELEEEMIAAAEESLAAPRYGMGRRLSILVDQEDQLRQEILMHRNYTRRDRPIHRWWRDLDTPLPEAPIAPGYSGRSMGDTDEFPARSWASWRAFHPDDPDDEYSGWEWYHNIQAAPLYRRDLDMVAVAPGGEVAAFCTIWFDDATRSAVCVLVGTAKEHQQRSLGKAVMVEGLHRLKARGGTRALANAYDPAADALYRAALGSKWLSFVWTREL